MSKLVSEISTFSSLNSLENIKQLVAHKVQVVNTRKQYKTGHGAIYKFQQFTHLDVMLSDLDKHRFEDLLMFQFSNTSSYLLESVGQTLANHHDKKVHVVPHKSDGTIDQLKRDILKNI